jgi:hypothetical protein
LVECGWIQRDIAPFVAPDGCCSSVFQIFGDSYPIAALRSWKIRQFMLWQRAFLGPRYDWAWSRVKLIAPHYVKPFVKGQKNDAEDPVSIVFVAQPLEDPLGRMTLFYRCGAVRSASRIASITGRSGPSFGLPTGFVRVKPGDSENRHIFTTVSRFNPNTGADCSHQQTQSAERRHKSPRHTSPTSPKKEQPNHWLAFTPPRSAKRRRSCGSFYQRPAQQ